MAEELIAVLGVTRPGLLHSFLETARVFLRDAVPLLGCTKMDVVDAVQIDVFEMPCECCLPHAEIEIGSVDTRNLGTEYIQDVLQFRYVPSFLVVIEQGARHVGRVHGLVESKTLPVLVLQFRTAFGSVLIQALHPVIEVLECLGIDVIDRLRRVIETPRRDGFVGAASRNASSLLWLGRSGCCI